MVDKPPQAPQSAGRKAHAANTKVARNRVLAAETRISRQTGWCSLSDAIGRGVCDKLETFEGVLIWACSGVQGVEAVISVAAGHAGAHIHASPLWGGEERGFQAGMP